MGHFSKVSVAQDARTELHDQLSLTGAEVSINNLPAGAGVPFVHSHKQNEEIYVVLSGKGKAIIDGERVALAVGDWVRISPAAKRQFSAAEDSGISFACIQVKENSLEGYTMDDAVIEEE
ncbi:cupin domain-containing protein [Eubacterium barkeri]|uniref:Cupin domain protein n=1 Tax=Eubacterium barkeri TaxID=1528 RepID=A0A1H3JQV4_EUBBA|nr:cupin domain-containing protein [Eubacterium barkeri]SDY42350.1 Cupin domain protein [Eubacterium barkeri]